MYHLGYHQWAGVNFNFKHDKAECDHGELRSVFQHRGKLVGVFEDEAIKMLELLVGEDT